MFDLVTPQVLAAFFQVIMIDLVLAGDNAIVIGLAAAGLPAHQRTQAILIGIAAATGLRVVFALMTTQLLQIVGLLFAGGILLLWVCWKMWRELATSHALEVEAVEAVSAEDINADGTIASGGGGSRQDLRAGRLADRDRRRLDVARQRAGGRRRRPRPSLCADLRPGAVDRPDGRRGKLHRQAAAASTAGSPMSALPSSSMWPAT